VCAVVLEYPWVAVLNYEIAKDRNVLLFTDAKGVGGGEGGELKGKINKLGQFPREATLGMSEFWVSLFCGFYLFFNNVLKVKQVVLIIVADPYL
jgi:hypothetical protein